MGVLDHINLDGTEYDIQDAGAYRKPQGGIPKSDLADGVKESLTKADQAAPQSNTYNKGEVDTKLSEKANANNVYTKTEADERLAQKANASDVNSAIGSINAKIPRDASSDNLLATELFVNSSISTSTATFRGTYNLVSDLSLAVNASHEQIATKLGTVVSGEDNNDYAFVQIPTSATTPTVISSVERYKYNGTSWAFEYALNNSGFTAAQWAAINSGITSSLVTKLGNLPTSAELTTLLNGKQDVIQDLQTIRSGAQAGATAVQPSDIAATPDFIEEEISADLTDEIDRILAVLYQALTDAGVQITAAQEAAALANAKAALAQQAATDANSAAASANTAAANANDKAALANTKAGYAQTQGDYAKQQGDYAKSEIDGAKGSYQSLDARFDAMDEDLSEVSGDVDALQTLAGNLDNEVEAARGTYQNLDARLDAIEEVEGDVTFIDEAEETFTF